MKSAEQLNLPEVLTYTQEHIWLKPDGDFFLAGISDYAQDQLGEVLYIDLPETGSSYKAHDEFGSIESVKAVNALFMPISGEIVEVNGELESSPGKVNSSCYKDGWLIKIKAADREQAKATMDAAAYRAHLASD